MAISSKTIFGIFEDDPTNACFHLEGKKYNKSSVKIGKEAFTIETVVHEIAELETVKILFNLKQQENLDCPNPIIDIDNHPNRIAHLLTPYGENSLLNPWIRAGSSKSVEEPLLF